MICKKCGVSNLDNSKFCVSCGERLEENNQVEQVNIIDIPDITKDLNLKYDALEELEKARNILFENTSQEEKESDIDDIYNIETKNERYSANSKQNQIVSDNQIIHNHNYDYQKEVTSLEEDELLKTFYHEDINKLSDINKDNNMTLFAFLFGPLYGLYRKLYLSSILISIIYCILFILYTEYTITSKFFLTSILILNAIYAWIFKSLYSKKGKKLIKKYKLMKVQNIRSKLKSSGGTSFLSLFLIIPTFIIVLVLFSIFRFIIGQIYVDVMYKESVTKGLIGNLSYKVNNSFKLENYSSKMAHYYEYNSDYTYCSFVINKYDFYKDYTEEEYINQTIYKESNSIVKETVDIPINGNIWKYSEVLNEYSSHNEYVIKKDGIIYSMSFSLFSDDTCLPFYKETLSSLKFNN